MFTVESFNEQNKSLSKELTTLSMLFEIRKNFYNIQNNKDIDYRKSREFEELFTQIVKVKKELKNLINDLEAELEIMTL